MVASNTANVQVSDMLATMLGQMMKNAERDANKTTPVTLAQLNTLYAGITRLCMVERHLHNITSGYYQQH